ncbi:MAG: IS91 family transposase [Betaproteobacteria bacterium]|nr:MAG: IS91 family transposase [Betaproteobacteria bacterium]
MGARSGKPELADIVRAHGAAFRAAHRLCGVQHRALRAIERCRTAALGGELRQCDRCGTQRYVYHSCRNRHCPKCQTRAKERWLAARRAELLPVPYYHFVFTLPHQLNALAQGNPRELYAMLFAAASETLVEFGENPRWLGGEIAATLVLHTWGQTLSQHLHVHCLVAAGALSPSGAWMRSRRGFLFPVKALSIVFRGKFLAALGDAFARGRLALSGATTALGKPRPQRALLAALRAKPWVVYAKRPFAGPDPVLDYLGRYTHRTAISNERLVALEDDAVRFRYKDYAHGARRRVMHLEPLEFLRRFALHVLPRGFNRIRHYGLLANRSKRALLARARAALDAPVPTPESCESIAAFWQRIAGLDIERCPRCHRGTLRLVATLAPQTHPPP